MIGGLRLTGRNGAGGCGGILLRRGAGGCAEVGRCRDWLARDRLALDRLPRYAAPIYLRIAPTTDMTGNYKLRKVDLQRQGYDTALVNDPLYIRDDKLQTYVPLNAPLNVPLNAERARA